MLDEAIIFVKAGNGGDGSVSLRREKYIPKGGPDGGDGGLGGSVYLESDPNLSALGFFAGRERFVAENGGRGGKRRAHGANGEDIVLKVPVGTMVWEVAPHLAGKKDLLLAGIARRLDRGGFDDTVEDTLDVTARPAAGSARSASSEHPPRETTRLIADMSEPGQRVCVAKGGKGGRGNWHFKSATNQTPREAEMGERAERRWLKLELKLLADVGLVGLPNAGKSTLLSVLTKAQPKVANYPFTTLSPNLGVMDFPSKSSTLQAQNLVIADIPGLIEGASVGKGLGIQFLKHIERVTVVVYVIAPLEHELTMAEKELGRALWEQYETVGQEMRAYSPELLLKPEVIVLNKIDTISEAGVRAVVQFFVKKGKKVLAVSAATLDGVELLREALISI